MEIVQLYQVFEPGALTKEDQMEEQLILQQARYLAYKRDKLDEVFSDMRNVRTVINNKLQKPGSQPARCSLDWWFLIWYKLNRMSFIATYYYLMPFLILVFQVLLLYSRQIYTQYLKKAEEPPDSIAAGDTTLL